MQSLLVEILSSLGILRRGNVLFVVEETSPKITDGITLLTCCRLDRLLNLFEILNALGLDVPTQTCQTLGKLGWGTLGSLGSCATTNGQHLLL